MWGYCKAWKGSTPRSIGGAFAVVAVELEWIAQVWFYVVQYTLTNALACDVNSTLSQGWGYYSYPDSILFFSGARKPTTNMTPPAM